MLKEIKKLFIEKCVTNWTGAMVDYNIDVRESKRFNGVAEIYVYYKTRYIGCWWVGKNGDEYIFEKQKDYHTARIDISVHDCQSLYVYYKDYIDDDKVEELVKNKYGKEIREKIANQILTGELDIYMRCGDTDGYECPPSQIKDLIITV